jgi:hypothetical protein
LLLFNLTELLYGRDPFTMGYFDNLDNGLLNKNKKIFKIEKKNT